MNNLRIEGTVSSPFIHADASLGRLEMGGDSYPENSFEMFWPLIDWLETYFREGGGPMHLELKLRYLNTSSVKVVMDIFDLLEEQHHGGRAVSVLWLYDTRNERVAELAEEFKEDCSFPFDIKPQQE